MKRDRERELFQNILTPAGITLGGDNPWDIRVNSPKFYDRVLKNGLLGAGESYMGGEWECDDIPQLIVKVYEGNIEARLRRDPMLLFKIAWQRFTSGYGKAQAFEIGRRHYDLYNDLFQAMLGDRLVYTCGYWKDAKTLEEAQEAKLDLVVSKIGLRDSMRVLDIGGGWGSFAEFAARRGASVVNITVSKEQVALANERTKGLSVENRLQDYRDVKDGPYDAIVSLGMFEHVCGPNYRRFMEVVHNNLADHGLFLLHTIGSDIRLYFEGSWVTKYIFPNSEIPDAKRLERSYEGLFERKDWHKFGDDYEKTLLEWFKRFDAHWPQLRPLFAIDWKDPEVFYRMWKLYLLGSAGSFRGKYLDLWQIVFSKHGIQRDYQIVR